MKSLIVSDPEKRKHYIVTFNGDDDMPTLVRRQIYRIHTPYSKSYEKAIARLAEAKKDLDEY